MEINYLELRDRLVNAYKENELYFLANRRITQTEKFNKYVSIFLGDNVDNKRVDSTNLSEFIRAALKDFHPDANNLDGELKDVVAFMTMAYSEVKRMDIHPTYAMNFEYINKETLENRNNMNNTNDSSDDSTNNTDSTDDIYNDVTDDETKDKNTSANSTDDSDDIYKDVTDDKDNTKDKDFDSHEIIIDYIKVKERLINASMSNDLNIVNIEDDERFAKYCKIILDIDDVNNVDIDNFKNVCVEIAQDFSNETINSYSEKIFVAEDKDLQNIQNFLGVAVNDLSNKFVDTLTDNPYKITYIARSKVNEADEALAYNMRNTKNDMQPAPEPEPNNEPDNNQEPKNVPEPIKDEGPDNNQNQNQVPNEDEEPNREEEPPAPALADEHKKDIKAYLKAIGKLLPYALAGAGVGLAASAVVPTVAFSGLGTIRIIYSTAKLANKIYSKGFLHGRPTKVDNIIMNAKEQLKEKYGDKKIYKAVEKVNEFLKNPKVQWFLNGAAVGYKIGEALDLHDKLNDMLHPKENIVDTNTITQSAPNEVPNNDPTINNNPSPNDIAPDNNINIDNPTVSNTPDYSSLNTGDNIDLSSIDHGFVNSANAMGEADPVHLLSQLASRENGTSIKLLKLPDGSNFTGNIGDLLQSGIDPNQVAARIVNQNGDYAWLNLQDILDVYNNGMGMSR